MVTAVAAIGIAVALGTTGCGAGQISQTANQLPAINGANVNYDELELRDVQILYPENDASTVFGDGGPFELAFVIANSDPLVYYRLKGINPEEGQVTFIEGAEADDRVIPPNGALRGGTPVGANPEFEKRLSHGGRSRDIPRARAGRCAQPPAQLQAARRLKPAR